MKSDHLKILVLLGAIAIISCGTNESISSASNTEHCKALTSGETKKINFIATNNQMQSENICINTEPGQTYTLVIGKSNGVFIDASNLAKFQYQVLTQDPIMGPIHQDTLIFGVDKNRLSVLRLYAYGVSQESTTVSLSLITNYAWWALPRDSVKLYANSKIFARTIIPQSVGDSTDKSFAWENSGFIDPDYSGDVKLKIPFDSVGVYSEWRKVGVDSVTEYKLYLQYLHAYGPTVEFFDSLGGLIAANGYSTTCNRYEICESEFKFLNLHNGDIYIKFGSKIRLWYFEDIRFRYRFESK